MAREAALDSLRRQPSTGAPAYLIVLCHGVAGTAHQLLPLMAALSDHVPQAAFLAPNAPFRHVIRRNWLMPWAGRSRRQWYALGGAQAVETDLAFVDVADDVRLATDRLARTIDAELGRLGLPAEAYALAGFSQGAIIVLHAGLRRAVPPRAIVAFSGGLMAPTRLAAEIVGRPPVLLVHGEKDSVVPPSRARVAEQALRAAGVPVETLYRPDGDHRLDPAGIAAAAAFLARVFGAETHSLAENPDATPARSGLRAGVSA